MIHFTRRPRPLPLDEQLRLDAYRLAGVVAAEVVRRRRGEERIYLYCGALRTPREFREMRAQTGRRFTKFLDDGQAKDAAALSWQVTP